MEKAWMRARNNSTNSYPVPKDISEYYKANADKYESEWDCYWSLIDAWAKADIAAGDTVVYEATTREAGDFINWMNSGKYSSNTSTFSYSGNGAVVSNLGNNKIEDVLEFDMTSSAERGVVHGVSGPNPFIDVSAAHAISYERAMWEAYTFFIQENISGKGISFYPVYAPLRTNGTASNGSHYDYTWTTNYIGHCFMNMLAGGEGIFFDANNVTFFDDIKAEIVEGSTTASGEPVVPFVEDFIGVDFDFTGEKIVLSFNGVAYTTNVIATAEGATASYAFVGENGKVGFTMDYFKGETPGKCIIAYTNESATLYPNGDRDYGQDFPKPFVEYCNPIKTPPTISFNSGEAFNISFMLVNKATGKVTFVKKIDIGGETSFVIPTEEGYVSAVFVKQSTSGMFWASEELDEATQNAVIACLKANNPSYKGHWGEFFFGAGDCTWEFKKNKPITYTFTGDIVVTDSDKETAEEIVDTPVVGEETTSNKNNGNGNNKNKDKNNKNKNK